MEMPSNLTLKMVVEDRRIWPGWGKEVWN